MGRRVVKKVYKDTSAPGERDKIEGNRYFLRIDLVSVKSEEEADTIGRDSEYYFEVGSLTHRQRTPVKGTIHVQRNEVFKPNPYLTLYSEFVESDEPKTLSIPFKIKERDPLKKDDIIVNTKLSIQLGQQKEFQVFKEKGAKVKIAISALKTRF